MEKQKNNILINLKKAIICLELHAEKNGVDYTIVILTKLWELLNKLEEKLPLKKEEFQEAKDFLSEALTRLHKGEYRKSPEEKAEILTLHTDMSECGEKELENLLTF